jgi:hypothetical protein
MSYPSLIIIVIILAIIYQWKQVIKAAKIKERKNKHIQDVVNSIKADIGNRRNKHYNLISLEAFKHNVYVKYSLSPVLASEAKLNGDAFKEIAMYIESKGQEQQAFYDYGVMIFYEYFEEGHKIPFMSFVINRTNLHNNILSPEAIELIERFKIIDIDKPRLKI